MPAADYVKFCQQVSKQLLAEYSTSFTKATHLFPQYMRNHIENIYALVRIADEIVDTYDGNDQIKQLDDLERETYRAIKNGFSANPIVHCFALTARQYAIGKDLIMPFFESMRMDLTERVYTTKDYKRYIYGSAEVVGLMCLKIFVSSKQEYLKLEDYAKRLGSAYQKVNFLRDIAEDYQLRGRYYFPIGSFNQFNNDIKDQITKEIAEDFRVALEGVRLLPSAVRPAVYLSYQYFNRLNQKIAQTDSDVLKSARIRLPDSYKLYLFMRAKFRYA